MRNIFIVVVGSIALASCQTDQPTTASGSPEVTLPGIKPDRAKPQIVNAALNAGLKMKADSPYQLTFERPWGGTAASIAVGALISVGAGPVTERLTFLVAETPNGTRVTLDRFMVKTAAYGREEASPANNAPGLEGLQDQLNKITGSIR